MTDQNNKKDAVPDTTQKKDGTTSAFSAASTRADAQDDNSDSKKTYREDGEQGRASFFPGTTTQGGSNHGQGSGYLGPSSYKQGSERTKGTNYENEVNRFAETGIQASGEDNASPEKAADKENEDGNKPEPTENTPKENPTGDEDTIGVP